MGIHCFFMHFFFFNWRIQADWQHNEQLLTFFPIFSLLHNNLPYKSLKLTFISSYFAKITALAVCPESLKMKPFPVKLVCWVYISQCISVRYNRTLDPAIDTKVIIVLCFLISCYFISVWYYYLC